MTTVVAVSAELVPVLKALADPTRLRLLRLLAGGERCVCDLYQPLELAQNLASHHLKVLREAGLVSVRRDSRWAYYSLRRDRLEGAWDELSTWLEAEQESPPSRCG
jgi:ArsR family transcriptional regulator, arsenate/arsenite/antimonite-responsive transcriptional repressor